MREDEGAGSGNRSVRTETVVGAEAAPASHPASHEDRAALSRRSAGPSATCPACGYENAAGSLSCGLCACLLVARPPVESPAGTTIGEGAGSFRLIDGPMAQSERRDKAAHQRRTRERRGHAVTGALTCAVLLALTEKVLGQPEVGGLAQAVFVGALVGLPLGYIIAWLGGGPAKGAFVSALTFAALEAVLSIPGLSDGALNSTSVGLMVVGGFVVGGLPGALVGWHVELSR